MSERPRPFNVERILKLPFVSCANNPLCPIRAMKNLMYCSPKKEDLSLFAFDDREGTHFYTHYTFVDRLRKILRVTGYDSENISGHSFRRGGATLAFAVGMSMFEIKKRGDWASDAVKEYIVVSDD